MRRIALSEAHAERMAVVTLGEVEKCDRRFTTNYSKLKSGLLLWQRRQDERKRNHS